MSQKIFRKISHPEQEISLYLYNFSKEVSQLTDRQTYKIFLFIWKYKKLVRIWKKCKNISGMSEKENPSRTGDIPIFV